MNYWKARLKKYIYMVELLINKYLEGVFTSYEKANEYVKKHMPIKSYEILPFGSYTGLKTDKDI